MSQESPKRKRNRINLAICLIAANISFLPTNSHAQIDREYLDQSQASCENAQYNAISDPQLIGPSRGRRIINGSYYISPTTQEIHKFVDGSSAGMSSCERVGVIGVLGQESSRSKIRNMSPYTINLQTVRYVELWKTENCELYHYKKTIYENGKSQIKKTLRGRCKNTSSAAESSTNNRRDSHSGKDKLAEFYSKLETKPTKIMKCPSLYDEDNGKEKHVEFALIDGSSIAKIWSQAVFIHRSGMIQGTKKVYKPYVLFSPIKWNETNTTPQPGHRVLNKGEQSNREVVQYKTSYYGRNGEVIHEYQNIIDFSNSRYKERASSRKLISCEPPVTYAQGIKDTENILGRGSIPSPVTLWSRSNPRKKGI